MRLSTAPWLTRRRAQGDKIDEGKKKESAVNSAMAKFRQLDAKNQEAADDGLATVHQNFIT
jgi:hypothetical protein